MTRERFIEAVEGEQKQLRRFLLALCCGNRDEADDIAQETLVKAYLSSGGFKEGSKFTAWLYTIARNTFLDHKRSSRTDEELSVAERTVAAGDKTDGAFEYQDLYCALGLLPYKERTAVLLFYLKGYSIKEISKITDCSEDAVKKQLSRGREQLRNKLER